MSKKIQPPCTFSAKSCFAILALSAIAASSCLADCGFSWKPFLRAGEPDVATGPVYALTVYKDELVSGGFFSGENIARWNGSNWQSFGPKQPGGALAFTVYNNELIAAYFPATPDRNSRIAAWNGSTWQQLGTGMGGRATYTNTNPSVFCLAVYNGELIAGGNFITAGGVDANSIARWDGTNWQPLGSGMNGIVYALAVYNGELIAGGHFTTAGGVDANSIARWDGTSWQPLGSGMNHGGSVLALAIYNGKLVAGGSFSTAGGIIAKSIAQWDGIAWQPLGSGTSGGVRALAVYNDELIAGGIFRAGPRGGATVARWDGSTWQLFITEMRGRVYALSVYNGELVVGGEFIKVGSYDYSGWARWRPDCPIIANAGPDQTVYAGIDGIAMVTLDGSDSNSPYADAPTYKWTWNIDANTYEANGVSPTIQLPLGVHTIQLVVNACLVNSQPDDVNITVVAPLEGRLKITPQTINRKSSQPHIQAVIELPDGIAANGVDISEPLVLYPGEIKAASQSISADNELSAFFDKAALMAAVPDGNIELKVGGKLKFGQYFYGTETIRIIDQKLK